ncbi:MAG TPA: P-II family nitrogen regulator [bacterium]|nr:P-II family nitrogen regulator [bacterium]
MKKIELIIRPEKFLDVKKALDEVGYSGMTVTEVQGHGMQKGLTQKWRGMTFKYALLPKMKIEIVAKDKAVTNIVKVIMDTAGTGREGDGKIFISKVEMAYRVRTRESGEKAIT